MPFSFDFSSLLTASSPLLHSLLSFSRALFFFLLLMPSSFLISFLPCWLFLSFLFLLLAASGGLARDGDEMW
jgi:hypothetical protein